jgi:hypothetical protein
LTLPVNNTSFSSDESLILILKSYSLFKEDVEEFEIDSFDL